MQKRKLGKSTIEVYPLAFGGNVLGWTIGEKDSFEVLDAFMEAGFNFIDTANSYSRWAPGHQGGESETILGKWMKERNNRDKIILATKVGSDMGIGKICLAKKYIIEEVENSLQRLQTDYIDLYQAHFDDLETPVGETLEAFNILIKQGKVRIIGASNFSASRLTEALDYSENNGLPSYLTFQPEYNLYAREKYEKEYEQICTDRKLGVITYFSLASGFLTGKYRGEKDKTKSVRGDGMQKYFNKRGFKILETLDILASKYGVTQAAIALAWLMNRPSVIAPIASATSIIQLNQIADFPDVNLDKADIELLTTASEY